MNSIRLVFSLGMILLGVVFTFSVRADESQAVDCSLRTLRVPFFEKYARQNDVYFVQLLMLALEKSGYRCGNYQIDYSYTSYSSRRYKAELEKNSGLIDVFWSMGSAELDRHLKRINLEVLKGMNGYRFLVVRSTDRAKFDGIKSLQDLAGFRAGQADDWPDVGVLRQNGLVVVTSIYADNLYKMLEGNRFDFLPRAVHEVENEIAVHGNEGVSYIPDLVLVYSAPVYFYVSKTDEDLGLSIFQGLFKAAEDGSWDKLFYSFPGFRNAQARMMAEDIKKIALQSDYP